MTYSQAVRHAVYAIIDADPSSPEARTAFLSLIPKEFHVISRQH